MAAEAVIGEDPAQIRMTGEDHAVHVEHLALQPAGDRIDAGHGRHRLLLVGGDADAQAMVLRHGQQVIDHLEALGPLGIVDPGNLHQLLIFEIVAQRGEHVGDALARDVDRDLVHLILRGEEGPADRRLHLVDDAVTDGDEGCRAAHISARSSPRGGCFRCNCMMP